MHSLPQTFAVSTGASNTPQLSFSNAMDIQPFDEKRISLWPNDPFFIWIETLRAHHRDATVFRKFSRRTAIRMQFTRETLRVLVKF